MKITARVYNKEHLVFGMLNLESFVGSPEGYVSEGMPSRPVFDGSVVLVTTEMGMTMIDMKRVFDIADSAGTNLQIHAAMDYAHFRRVVAYLLGKGIVSEKGVTFDSRSFRYREEFVETMNWCQIVNHDKYIAGMPKLREAIAVGSPKQVLRLRDIISAKITQGYTVGSDFADASFYFWKHDDTRVSNGGIIWHPNAGRWSVHT